MPQCCTQLITDLHQDKKFLNAFKENLLTREEWASLLGIDRATLWRWESKIISKVPPLLIDYNAHDRPMRSHYLDNYQRFLIACIYLIKDCESRSNAPNDNAIAYLRANFLSLKRNNFEQWRISNDDI